MTVKILLEIFFYANMHTFIHKLADKDASPSKKKKEEQKEHIRS